MGSVFTKYITTFECSDSMQETIDKIMTVVTERRNNLKLISARYTGKQEIVLHSVSDSILLRGRSCPVINMQIVESDKGAEITMIFSQKKYEKILACIVYSALILFQIFLIVLYGRQSLLSLVTSPVCFPALFIVLFWLFTLMGLESASQKILDVFYKSIMQSNAKALPELKRC